MADVHPEEAFRDLGNEADSKIQNFMLEIIKDVELYEKFQTIETSSFDDETNEFYEDLKRDFKDAGHGLDEKNKKKLLKIEKKLIDLGITFSENIAKDKTQLNFSLEELEGLSEEEINNLKKDGDTFVVTMAYPDINAVTENCKIRTTREAVWKAFNNRALESNRPILEEAVVLRNEKAKIFGFNTWADYRLQNRMAKNPSNVQDMYEDLIPKLQQAAEFEKNNLVIDEIEVENIAPWDIRYFVSAERSKVSSVEASELKKYFFIHDVKKEMFSICEGFSILKLKKKIHLQPGIKMLNYGLMGKNGDQLAYFYLDLHPRDGKYTHAAVFDISSGGSEDQNLPVCSMVANFPNPHSEGLMTFDEVETLFHEFGHVLHNGIGKSNYSRFVGANCEWDFVEAPSQIMEHWVWKVECLKNFKAYR